MKRTFYMMIVVSVSILLACTQLSADQHAKPDVVHISTEDMKAWAFRGPSFMNKWMIGDVEIDSKNERQLVVKHSKNSVAALINRKKGSIDIITQQSFGDCILEIEVMIPKQSNSGIYLMGRYEVQIKDSYGKGKNTKNDDMGAIFNTSRPMVNAAGKPGEWQKYKIEFRAPRFEDGKRIEPAEFVKVVLNGEVVQKNVKMGNGPTRGALDGHEVPTGPLMLQGGLGPAAYRNIFITLTGFT